MGAPESLTVRLNSLICLLASALSPSSLVSKDSFRVSIGLAYETSKPLLSTLSLLAAAVPFRREFILAPAMYRHVRDSFSSFQGTPHSDLDLKSTPYWEPFRLP